MIETQILPVSIPMVIQNEPDDHLEICRLLAAATVNPTFRQLLLTDPVQALEAGYQGESFFLTADERNLIVSIQADNLESLAWQIFQAYGQPSYAPAPSVMDTPLMISL